MESNLQATHPMIVSIVLVIAVIKDQTKKDALAIVRKKNAIGVARNLSVQCLIFILNTSSVVTPVPLNGGLNMVCMEINIPNGMADSIRCIPMDGKLSAARH